MKLLELINLLTVNFFLDDHSVETFFIGWSKPGEKNQVLFSPCCQDYIPYDYALGGLGQNSFIQGSNHCLLFYMDDRPYWRS